MLIWNADKNSYQIDPHYLTIHQLKVVWNSDKSPKKEIGEAKLMWLYHMFNPHSPFRDYRISEKSASIVRATFPKSYVLQKEKEETTWRDAIIAKNAEIERNNRLIDEMLNDLEGKPSSKLVKKDLLEIPEITLYNPAQDDVMLPAIDWYKENHLKHTPLWNAVGAYDEAMYNLSDIVRSPKSTAGEIKTASAELDDIPKKREKMRQQAIKDEAQTLKTSGDKNIKRGEMLPQNKNRKVAMI